MRIMRLSNYAGKGLLAAHAPVLLSSVSALAALSYSLSWPSSLLADVTIVAARRPRTTIVIGKNAVEPIEAAAHEFQVYVKKMTGAELPIRRDDEAVTGPQVLIGESEGTRRLGLKDSDFAHQEYLIRAEGENLILMGHDESKEVGPLKMHGEASMMWPYIQSTGSLYAVDTFLEKYCGMRWYMPTELGEVVPRRTTLRIPPVNVRRRPSTRHRSVMGYHIQAFGAYPAALWQWGPKGPLVGDRLTFEECVSWGRRLKMGGEVFNSSHGQSPYAERFGVEHPDWFANGVAKPEIQLCYSNPEVFEQVVQDARDFFDTGKLTPPRQQGAHAGNYFAVWPVDSNNWCECADCKPKFNPRKPSKVWFNDHASEYVWDFVARVAREVAKTHPGKIITCGSYAEFAAPPRHVDIPDNVAVVICKKHSANWHPLWGNEYKERFNAWKNTNVKHVYFWDYYYNPQAQYQYENFPSIAPREIARDIAAMKKAGFDGGQMCQISLEGTSPESYYNMAYDHLRLYVTMKLLDDWDQDVDVMLSEYYRLFYGPAEKPMRAFFEGIERTYYQPKAVALADEYGAIYPDVAWTKLCPPKVLKSAGDLIEQARRLAPAGSIYRRRVDLIDKGIYRAVMVNSSRKR